MTVSKALAGGLPLGALICGPEMAGIFEPGDHGSTSRRRAGHICRSARRARRRHRSPSFYARVRVLGERLRHSLAELPHVKWVRDAG